MKKCEIVKKSWEFDKIIKNGKCVKNNSFVIYYLDNLDGKKRFGISVSKKIGNAVKRNYYKRIIRKICDINKNIYSKGKDYIIIMRVRGLELSFNELNESILDLLEKIK